MIDGPAGTGKSLAMLFKIHLAALAVPGLRALLVRQTHASLTGTTLVTFERTVAQDAMAAGIVNWYGGSSRQPAAYRYANGSEILVGGLDRPEKFLSSEFDRIAIDEATEVSELALETLITRLRGTAPTYKQVVCAANPAHPTHWLKQRADRGTMQRIISRHRDNPAYVNSDGSLTERGQDYLDKLDALTGVRRLRYRDGAWAAAEGQIYEAWDESVHLIDPFKIPNTWTRWAAVDFGYTAPFCFQDWREDPDGRLYLVNELYFTRRLVEDHARQIKEQLLNYPSGEPRGPRPRAIFADHDAEDRATLERHLGLSTTAATKTVSDGIQAVQSRLKVQPDGKPRLFIVRGALVERDQALEAASLPTCTAEEITGYVWAVKPGAAGGLKEAPAKENDHGMDALRYMAAARDLKGRTRVRWL
ncbi:phage terminase large subunit [Streptomyces sp. ISL-98]|uniref:phage terminase large subunit n=1 Tax=Streptomyces sp. ISL-98 TaxID=2819192 RepID=UPI00203583B7|nr:phage terminase large subunit [Streptomyces sp. ISL-98]